MTEPRDRHLAALDQVEDLLEAYAEARLAPAGPVLSRMRAHVLAQAAAAAAVQRLPVPDAKHPSVLARLEPWAPRRAVALGMAAVLALGASAAVLAAPPGSPLYDARVAIEAAFLPVAADARLASHEEHLSQRLAEAQAAAARGDIAALQAALAAYQAEVDAAVTDVGGDLDLLARLQEMLGKHVSVLTALEATLPDQASIDNAIERSQKAVERIVDKGVRGGGRPSDTPTGPSSQPGR